MAESEKEAAGEDASGQEPDSPALATVRRADMFISLGLFAFAALMGFDNWRTGMSWAMDGPQAGYFPFYLSVFLGAASLYGFVSTLVRRGQGGEAFVTRAQLRRVLQVFVPTLAFCLLTQWLGLYVASFLLIASFMRLIGRIALWKSLLTGFVFAAAMFVTFELAFDVIMPKGPIEALFGH